MLQNVLTKFLSLSLAIEFGTPWSLTILVTKALATVDAVNGCHKGMKSLYFESLSTTTIITIWPCKKGSSSMKSMYKSVHILFGIGRGLVGLRQLVLKR